MNEKATKISIRPIYGWNSGDSVIHFVYRDEKRLKKLYKVDDFYWYFCIDKKDYEKEEVQETISFFQKRGVVLETEESTNFIKIYCAGDRRNPDVKFFLERLKEKDIILKETDISLTKRYMIDNMIEIEDDLKYLFFDIETDDSGIGIEIGRDRILSWAACDNEGKTFFEINENSKEDSAEEELIRKMVRLFTQYDLIIGWNSKQFDIPYIEKRIEILDIRTKDYRNCLLNDSIWWRMFIHIDLMQRLIKLFGPMMTVVGLTGFSLNEVSKVFIGKEKIEHSEKIHELYKKDPAKLKKYNINDVKLVFELNERLRTLPLMIKECLWTGTFMDRFYIGELLDNYILREANKQDFHLKSRPDFEEAERIEDIRIRGGYVMNPQTGLYDNVRTLDFKSMYPSIIVGWNIGQESLIEGEISDIARQNFKEWISERKIEEIPFIEWYEFLRKENKKLNPTNKYLQTANNQFFSREKPSIIAGLVKRLLQERKAYKKQQIDSEYNSIEYKNSQASQEAVKEMSNSMYGITADKQSRYFDPRIAEAITMTGHFINRTTMEILKKMEYAVIYGDTDSIFTIVKDDAEMIELTKTLNEKLSKHLIKTYKFHENIISIEYEKKFRKFIMLDKKRYAGHLVEIDGKKVDSILSKGTENVRKSTIDFTRKKVNECLDLLVKKDKDEKHMKKWIRDLKEFVMNEDISGDELAITMKLSKLVSSYKSKPPHVRLAEKLIASQEILETHEGKHVWGQKIEYVITDSKNKDGIILSRDFDDVWDRRYYWDVQIYAPLMRILKIIWPESNWEEHNIILMEKMQRKAEQEEKKKQKEIDRKEKEEKKKHKTK